MLGAKGTIQAGIIVLDGPVTAGKEEFVSTPSHYVKVLLFSIGLFQHQMLINCSMTVAVYLL